MANIQTEHPEYVSKKATLQKYRLLYQGGEALRAEVSQYLLPRQKEPGTVYQERVNRFFYENYVGSIIDWYSATLFRREPMVILEGVQEASRSFYNEFAEDCDLKGTTISDFFRQQLVETLVGGASYIVVDFPRLEQHFMSRAEEDHYGASRAYLAAYTAEDLINWSHDQRGNLEWAVFRTQRLRADSAGEEHVLEQRWVYYDRTTYAVYRARANEKDQEPELVAKGLHGLARQRRVPVFELKVTDGLWLMNKAGLLQLEHMNKSNALSWALTMGLFSMPVVYSDRPFHQVLGESYYIQLAPEDRFGWTEPEGHVFQVAVDNLNRLKDEIYRTCFLMVQAGGPLSSGASQSGLSKQRDYAITQEVLRAYGDAVKDCMKRVLRAIGTAREDALSIDVSGLDEFDIGDFSSELSDAERLLFLNIGSATLRKQILNKLALKYLCDVRQEVKDRVVQEIDAWCRSQE